MVRFEENIGIGKKKEKYSKKMTETVMGLSSPTFDGVVSYLR